MHKELLRISTVLTKDAIMDTNKACVSYIDTGLSGSVLGKLPSRFQDEKHIFCENYVGF